MGDYMSESEVDNLISNVTTLGTINKMIEINDSLISRVSSCLEELTAKQNAQ